MCTCFLSRDTTLQIIKIGISKGLYLCIKGGFSQIQSHNYGYYNTHDVFPIHSAYIIIICALTLYNNYVKISRDVIFELNVCMVNWPSVNFSLAKPWLSRVSLIKNENKICKFLIKT